ncbi:MAG: hypothetical protein A2498_12905 [Lentisphaerae bacterium RIFOXYC12_FULL_60_16]|nr:MAG: hypothetical protein A2498_12905 [Lentisphaerae bacterium RIFOXYC12_FULL_60_16]
MIGLDTVRVVLVGTLYGGNVGSVCRAMANMGCCDLALVAPQNLDMDEARMMACHATDILDSRSVFDTLADAVQDCSLVVGSTAREGLYRQHVQSPREWAPRIVEAAGAGRVALVFGREDNGLNNEEIGLCSHLVRIPTAGYRSLNLAQSVMICLYELFVATGRYEPPAEKSIEAPSGVRERMFTMWRESLLAVGFMQADKADHMMLGVRRIFSRGRLTEDDARILMGVARQMNWLAGEWRTLTGEPPGRMPAVPATPNESGD